MSLLKLLQRAFLVLTLFYVVATFAQPTTIKSRQEEDSDFEENEFDAETTEAVSLTDAANAPGGRLYYLSQSKGQILSIGPNGEAPKVILSNLRGKNPDGIAVDKAAGFIYFTNMNPGTVNRVNLDGSGLKTLVPAGVFQVGKQLTLVTENGQKKLYWSDREGMKIMRSNIDGTSVEIVVDTSKYNCTGAQCKHAVGVAVDTKNGWVYWTQKGAGGTGSINRAPTKMPAGATASTRADIQTILSSRPEPIDLQWADGYGLYWTERSRLPGGNSVNRIPISPEAQAGKAQFAAKGQLLVSGLQEGIGLAVHVPSNKMWFTDLGGKVYSANLDGTAKKVIASAQGILTGIDYAA